MGCTWFCHMSLTFNLHMTYQLHTSLLYCLCYELFFTPPYRCYNLILFVPTWPSISTSFFGSRSFTRRIWAKQVVCFNLQLMRKDYLQTNAPLNLVVIEQEEYPHALQRKATGRGAMSKVVRRRLAKRSQAWLLGRQHQLLLGHLYGRVTSQYLVVTMQR